MRMAWLPLAAALLGAPLFPDAPARAQQGSDAPSAKPPAAPAQPTAPAPANTAEPLRIDKQASHENGSQVIVNTLAARRTSVVLNVTITTGEQPVDLNTFGMTLVDDQGGRHQVVPPEGNRTLNVPAHSALEGDLVFSGRLNPAAKSLTLLVNERGGSPNGRVTNSPQLRLQFPVQQQTGQAEPLDGPESSAVLIAALPAGDEPLRAEALTASALAAGPDRGASVLRPAEAPEAGASRLGSGGAGSGAIAPGRLSQVEQLRRELDVRPTDRGEMVALPGDVLFDFDRADIRRDAEPTLHKLARLIVETKPGRVLVEGHTDSRGSDAYNQRLSERRAQAVERWLVGNGASGPRYVSRGFGESRPVAPNNRPNGADDSDGRQRNRRVEVVLQRA